MPNRSRPWTIEDTAISSHEQDRFDHRSVARELAEVVLGCQEPLAIGLLGPFGSGKSSVVKLLEEELAVNKTWAVLHVSAEHHTGTARARALLYGLIDAAHRKGLIDEEIWASERACLEGQRQRAVPRPDPAAHRPGRASWQRYPKALGAATGWIASMLASVWLLGVLAVFVGHQSGLGHGVTAWTWFAAHGAGTLTAILFSASIVAGVLGAGRDGALQALKGYEITVTTPRPESTDELEQAFTRLIDLTGKRLVIAVDDIDRLTAADVLEALTTVRSLLLAGTGHRNKPVFVLSCDEAIVREAVSGVKPGLAHRTAKPAGDDHSTVGQSALNRQAREEAAQEYLNKLFTVRRTLPAHDDRDLRDYVAGRLSELDHPVIAALGGVEALGDVLDTLIHPQVRDPRHAIRLVNAFVHDYYLASLREQPVAGRQPRISPGEVTGHPLELARLAVLRQDYRTLYDRVADEHALLHLLDDALLGDGAVLSDPLLQDFLHRNEGDVGGRPDTATWPGLNYLRATAPRARDRRPRELGALITLGSSVASRLLGSQAAAEVQLELLQRDGDAIAARLAGPGPVDRVLRAMDATIDAARVGQDLDNAIAASAQALGGTSALAACAATPQAEVGRALFALTDRIARRREDMRTRLRAQELAALLPYTRPAQVPQLLAALRQQPVSDVQERRLWAETLLTIPPGPNADALVGAVNGYFDMLADSGTAQDLTHWLASVEDLRTRWTAHVYGALLAMAGRLEDADSMEKACRLVASEADQHLWSTPVVLGAVPSLDAGVGLAHQAVGLLALAPVPDDGWGPFPEATVAGGTVAARLVDGLAALLDEDDEEASRVGIAHLLGDWLDRVAGQISPDTGDTVSRTIATAIARNAATSEGMVDAVAGILPALPADDAAHLAAELAQALRAHHAEAGLGPKLQRVLVEYLRQSTNSADPTTLEAADVCLTVLAEPLVEDTPSGRLSRQGLPALLSTSRGAALRGQYTERLLLAIPIPIHGGVPAQGHPGELLGSLGFALKDPSIRSGYLPRLLERLQQSLQQNGVAVPVDFACSHLGDPAVHQQWLAWIVQYWGHVSDEAKDRALRGALRPEVRENMPMVRLLSQRLVQIKDPEAWKQAGELYDSADPESRATLLANAADRALALADRAAAADTTVLVSAFLQAGTQISGPLALARRNPQLTSAICQYLQQQLDSADWHADRIKMAVKACPEPAPVWTLALDAATHDRTSLERAADIVAALSGTHPDSMPSLAVDVVVGVVMASDNEVARLLGTALRPLAPAARRQLVRALTGASQGVEQSERLKTFKRACPAR